MQLMSEDTPKLDHEFALRIIEEISLGEFTTKVLKRHGISNAQWRYFVNNSPILIEKYTAAREESAENFAAKAVESAEAVDEDPNRSRLKIDTYKWVASKIAPQTFGDRIELNITKTVDIGTALADARNRIKLVSEQPIGIIDITRQLDTDAAPVAHEDDKALSIDKAIDESSDDIYK